jgi:hypothetical protein
MDTAATAKGIPTLSAKNGVIRLPMPNPAIAAVAPLATAMARRRSSSRRATV